MRNIKLITFIAVLGIAVVVLSIQQGDIGSDRVSAASGGGPEMALTVTQDGFCDGNNCYAEAGSTFKLGVELVEAPATGYIVLQTFIDFGPNLTYNPTASAIEEVPWPHGTPAFPAPTFRLTNIFDTVDTVNHGAITGWFNPVISYFEGIGVEIELACPASPTQETVTLLPYLDPVAYTMGSVFIDPTGVAITPKVDSITLNCVDQQVHPGDTDGDGCSDVRESGADPAQGGDRDWLNPWDFYDVASAGGVPVPDGVIDLSNDYLGVVNHYAPQGDPPYDVHYDRGLAAGPSWNDTLGPDGVIDLSIDIMGVIGQIGHSCM